MYDCVVVGAGIAGCSVAYALAKHQNRKVLLVERDLTEPDRIVGELLQPGGVRALKELGLEHCVENIDAQEVYGYAIFRDDKQTCIKYPIEENNNNDDDDDENEGGKKKLAGRSFHNGRFVRRLREACAEVGRTGSRWSREP